LRYKNIVHYSKCSREKDKHPGGVEKFAWYLQKAIGCDIVTPEDRPDLNNKETLYIVDNHWGLDIGKDCKVICVLHGCAIERGFNIPIGNKQKKIVSRSNTYFVANSLETANLCKQYYNSHVDEIIYLAVDENIFWPRIKNKEHNIILTSTANKHHKGYNTIKQLQSLYKNKYKLIDMNCPLNEEASLFKQADLFLLLSIHEGFAYSVLEAMCANLPIITGKHGIAYEIRNKNIITIEDAKLNNTTFINKLILDSLNNKDEVTTRDWVLNNCTFKIFSDKWNNLIEKLQND